MLSNISAALAQFAGCFTQVDGQGLAEYSLILAFMAAACVPALTALGLTLAGQLDVVTAAFP